jgi:thiol-disulfide isomerase/thioredoxin
LAAKIAKPGARVMLVNLWATWCDSCVAELPHIIDLAARHSKGGLEVLLVSMDAAADRGKVEAFLKDKRVGFDSYINSEEIPAFLDAMPKQWGGALPATWVVTGDGKVRDFWQGEAPLKRFDDALRPHLKSSD